MDELQKEELRIKEISALGFILDRLTPNDEVTDGLKMKIVARLEDLLEQC